MKKQPTQTKEEKLIIILLFIFWSRESILRYLFGWLGHIPLIGNYFEAVFFIFVIACIIMALKLITSKVTKYDFLFIVIFALLYILGYLYPGNAEYLTQHLPLLVVEVIPAYFLGLAINLNTSFRVFRIKKSIFDWLYFISIIGILFAIAYYLYYTFSREAGTDVGGWATILIPSTIMCICFAFRKKIKLIPFVFSLAAVILLFVYGTRMALVCVVVGFLFYLIEYKRFSKLLIFILCSIFFVVVFNSYFFQSISQMKIIFENYNLNTRILDLIISNDIHIEARFDFFSKAIAYLSNQPLIGYGIMGDRVIFGGYQEYAHNIFLEILLDYGILVGTFIILFVGYTLTKGFISLKNDVNTRDMFILLFSFEIVNLMMSGSYLSDKYLFLLLGISVSAIRKNLVLKSNNILLHNWRV